MPKRTTVAIAPSGALVAVLAISFIALTGCSASADPAPTASATVSQTPTPTPTPTETAPPETAFTMPADCIAMIPEDRIAELEGMHGALLGGPGSAYGDYYLDPTPEEMAGGISCVWGDEAQVSSIVTISVAPLTAGTRSIVIDDLLQQGLNEAPLEEGTSFAQIGDTNAAPAVLNVIRGDSWISVIQAIGGQERFDEAVELAEEVASEVYLPVDGTEGSPGTDDGTQD